MGDDVTVRMTGATVLTGPAQTGQMARATGLDQVDIEADPGPDHRAATASASARSHGR